MKNERAVFMDLTWSNSLSFYKIDFKRNKKTRMNERYSHIHIFMSYSYPTRVVNGYWLRYLLYQFLDFRTVFLCLWYFVNGWVPQKSTRTSETSRKRKHIGFGCLSCAGVGFVFVFFFFVVGPHTELGPKSSSAHFRPLLIFNVSNSRLSL